VIHSVVVTEHSGGSMSSAVKPLSIVSQGIADMMVIRKHKNVLELQASNRK